MVIDATIQEEEVPCHWTFRILAIVLYLPGIIAVEKHLNQAFLHHMHRLEAINTNHEHAIEAISMRQELVLLILPAPLIAPPGTRCHAHVDPCYDPRLRNALDDVLYFLPNPIDEKPRPIDTFLLVARADEFRVLHLADLRLDRHEQLCHNFFASRSARWRQFVKPIANEFNASSTWTRIPCTIGLTPWKPDSAWSIAETVPSLCCRKRTELGPRKQYRTCEKVKKKQMF